jgi:hypothetical protein
MLTTLSRLLGKKSVETKNELDRESIPVPPDWHYSYIDLLFIFVNLQGKRVLQIVGYIAQNFKGIGICSCLTD